MNSLKLKIVSLVLTVIAAVSSFILMMEEIELWQNPDYIPSCSWNILFSCQGPMESWQATALIVPNPLLGIIGYTILAMVLIISLQTKLPNWVWVGYFIGVSSSLVYLTWLQQATIYEIGALCIYCMIVWACAIPLFWLSVKGFIDTHWAETKLNIISKLTPTVITVHYMVLLLLIYIQFQDFWLFLFGVR